MDKNNNYTPYSDFEDTTSTPVPDEAPFVPFDPVPDMTVNTTVDTTVNTSVDTSFDTPAPSTDAPATNAPAPEALQVEVPASDAPKQRNYERYMNEGEWQPTQQPAAPAPAPFATDDFRNQYASGPSIPEGLEEPVSMGEWLISLLLLMIPCANIILMFVWAFSKTEKKSKSNFFKAELIIFGVVFALYFIVIIFAAVAGIAAYSGR